MAWETRGRDNGPYYYHSKKVAGKVKRQYLGKGERARQAAAQVAQRQAERVAQAEADHARAARYQDADAAFARAHPNNRSTDSGGPGIAGLCPT